MDNVIEKLRTFVLLTSEKGELDMFGKTNDMKGNLNPQEQSLRLRQGHRINKAKSVAVSLFSFLIAAS